MLSKKPYLLRAMHQWIVDNGHTPHIVVDTNMEGVNVKVPRGYAKDGKLVLNISYDASHKLELESEYVQFSARFAGVSQLVHIPMDAVLAIYAFETGQGMIFEAKEAPVSHGSRPDKSKKSKSTRSSGNVKPDLKVVK